MQLQRHLKTLVADRGLSVAIAEEMPRDEADKIRRRVVRVVTPGTLTDEHWLDRSTANYLLAIQPTSDDLSRPGALDLTWYDVGTGDLLTQTTSLAALGSDMARIDPREIVLPAGAPPALVEAVGATRLPTSTVAPSTEAGSPSSLALLGSHLSGTVFRVPTLDAPEALSAGRTLLLDSDTLASLEIRQSLRGTARGSVYSAIRRTVTQSGGRALLRRLCTCGRRRPADLAGYPSTDLATIRQQHDLVEALVGAPRLLDDIAARLRRAPDAAHLLQRISLGKATAADLLAVADLATLVDALRDQLDQAASTSSRVPAFASLSRRLADLSAIRATILAALDAGAADVSEGALSGLEGDEGESVAIEPPQADSSELFSPRPLRVQASCVNTRRPHS